MQLITFGHEVKRRSIRRIKKNSIQCNHCGDVIVSEFWNDFRYCSCGCVSVDGGTDYLRRTYSNSREDYTELSEYEEG